MLNINQLSWTSLPFRFLSHGTLSSRSQKRSNSSLLKARVGILVFALLSCLRILNFTISWSLQSVLFLQQMLVWLQSAVRTRAQEWEAVKGLIYLFFLIREDTLYIRHLLPHGYLGLGLLCLSFHSSLSCSLARGGGTVCGGEVIPCQPMWGASTVLVHLMTVSQGLWIGVLYFISPANEVGGERTNFHLKAFLHV